MAGTHRACAGPSLFTGFSTGSGDECMRCDCRKFSFQKGCGTETGCRKRKVHKLTEKISRGNIPASRYGGVFFLSAHPCHWKQGISPGQGTALANYMGTDRTAVGRATYPEFFAAIGTMYGEGNGETSFNLPDLIERFGHMPYDRLIKTVLGGRATETIAGMVGVSEKSDGKSSGISWTCIFRQKDRC